MLSKDSIHLQPAVVDDWGQWVNCQRHNMLTLSSDAQLRCFLSVFRYGERKDSAHRGWCQNNIVLNWGKKHRSKKCKGPYMKRTKKGTNVSGFALPVWKNRQTDSFPECLGRHCLVCHQWITIAYTCIHTHKHFTNTHKCKAKWLLLHIKENRLYWLQRPALPTRDCICQHKLHLKWPPAYSHHPTPSLKHPVSLLPEDRFELQAIGLTYST